MRKGNYQIILLELVLVISLFFALFASKIIARYVLAVGLSILTIILKHQYRIKSDDYIYSKQVNIFMIFFATVYISVFYALGLYFGIVKSKYDFSFWVIERFIIPFTLIIVSGEYLRKILLSQDAKIEIKGRKYNLSLALTFIIMVLIDLIIYTGIYDLNTLEDALMAIGFVLFASISCNLLYQYVTRRFGVKGIIYYRLITTLFIYIIPLVPDVYIFMRSFLRMIYPFIIYLILENTYAKTNLALSYRSKKNNIITTSITLVVLALLVMLISCQFKFGIVVIGTGSMTGTINKGDAVIYEKYDGEVIPVGQVIMFNHNGFRTIHRVIKASSVDGEMRYYTKGDANKDDDEDYRTANDVIGVIRLKVKYIGLPTLWLRNLFEKN